MIYKNVPRVTSNFGRIQSCGSFDGSYRPKKIKKQCHMFSNRAWRSRHFKGLTWSVFLNNWCDVRICIASRKLSRHEMHLSFSDCVHLEWVFYTDNRRTYRTCQQVIFGDEIQKWELCIYIDCMAVTKPSIIHSLLRYEMLYNTTAKPHTDYF